MKKCAFLLLLLGTTAMARDLTWGDLETGHHYASTVTVRLKPTLRLNAGTRMQLTAITPLDQIQVLLFEFRLVNCPGSLMNQKSEIVIVQELYGVELEPGCKINEYVEFKDAVRKSLLK
jgi:hypothetical protein